MVMKCPKCQSDNADTLKFCGECGTQLIPSEKISVSQTKTLETKSDELTRGTVFAGKYEIIEELGKGGMGRVYRAYDKKIEDEVALKLIKPEIAADGNTIERFRNELRLARKIGHRNVCKMYDLNEEEGTYYITMEYVSGEDLKNMIRMTGQLSVETAVNIGKQICEGLAEAHHLGVIHRDLKPQNIMIDKRGNVRIMDFGIARSVKARGITGTGMMIGTPEYMSPEQAEGYDVDQRSDIYSLGIILYEMVTGKVPFKGETPLSVVMKHKSESPRSPKEINAQISQGLSRLILKCMEKNKEERYQNVEELLSELDKIGVAQKEAVSVLEWKNSVAVLPFADLSPQKDQEYFCDGIAEEIINALTKIKDLRVVARTSSFSFKDTKIDVREIGRKLNVEKILEGSLRKAGNRLRIMAQLINVEDGYHIWSERYDRDLDDVFAIQDDVTLAIVDNLKVKLLKGERVEHIKRHSKDLEAYNLYLKGSYFWNKRTAEGLNRAIKCFQEAIEKDPDYALAYAGLADSYLLLTYYSSLAPQENFARAKTAAEKALEMNENLAEVHTTLALAKIKNDRDWEGAEKEYKRALELNPNYAKAHFWYAWYFIWIGRINEALEETQRAHELDPLSLVINSDLGLAFFFARQYDQAIEQFHKTFEIEPDYIYIHLYLGWAYLQKSMYEEALAEILKERELLKDWNPLVEAWLGVAYVQIDKREKAREVLDELIKRSKKAYVSPYHIATVYFALGENDQGFQWLNKAYKEKDYWLLWIKIEPFFDNIRQDPRYKELLKIMGLLNE
jgi:serine/threonine protein kinase/tetratricopeptide (TPR) repeat protein